MPPRKMKAIFEFAYMLFHHKTREPQWNEVQRWMASPSWLQAMQEFDKDQQTDEVVYRVDEMIRSYDEDLSPDSLRKVSLAAHVLAYWVHAMISYHGVAKVVEPKKMKLAELVRSGIRIRQRSPHPSRTNAPSF